MTVNKITWSWGQNSILKFDPQSDIIDFGWMQATDFTILEKSGSVIINIPTNQQSYVLDGVSLSDLKLSSFSSLDSNTLDALKGVLNLKNIGNGIVTQPVFTQPVAIQPVVTQPDTQKNNIKSLSIGGADVYHIQWNWGTHTHIKFNINTDKLDFSWIQSSSFKISEINGSTVISIPSNDQSYTLDGIGISELSLSNITALDPATKIAWETAISGVRDNSLKNEDGIINTSSNLGMIVNQPVVLNVGDNIYSDSNNQKNVLNTNDITSPLAHTNYQFAPYVDMTSWPTPELVEISKQSGINHFTLAFMVSDSQHGLSWGGVAPVTTDTIYAESINAFERSGGQVTLSFGGANGTEAALNANDASSLAIVYQSAIDKYHSNSIDFDIEGGALADKKSVDLRNQAIAILERKNPNLEVSYTLPVLPDGLSYDGVNLLKSAVSNNTRIDIVNIMAMDYGGNYDIQFGNHPDMGIAAINASENTLKQLDSIGLPLSKVGITPMIGVNDDNNEIFTLQDAGHLAHYAASNSEVGRLALWSIGRDNGNGAGQKWASSTSSGLEQHNYDFSKTLTNTQTV